MKRCPFCAEEIQLAAIVCKHCRRDLPVPTVGGIALADAPVATTTEAPRVRSGVGAVIVVALIAVIGLTVLSVIRTVADPTSQLPARASKTLDVSVRWNALMMTVTNDGSPEATGQELDLYLNGTPPFTYKATATMPELHKSVSVLLNQFVYKGDRFNPVTMAPEKAWVGGGGYDFQSFGK